MATLVLLPTELLAHIVHLANEGSTAEEQQRRRFTLSLVARALFLACADATTFYAAGEKQIKALVAKLEREKKWAAQEQRKAASGRTTRSTLSITRVGKVRQLAAVLTLKTSGKSLATLLRATPDLAKLELNAQNPHALKVPALEPALKGLVHLRELHLSGTMMSINVVVGLLCSLPDLELLDAAHARYSRLAEDADFQDQNRALLPRLREYRTALPTTHSISIFQPPPHASNLLALLAASPELRVLDLATTTYSTLIKVVDKLLPHLAQLTQFLWTPDHPRLPDVGQRAQVLKLIAALVDLEHVQLRAWTERSIPSQQLFISDSSDDGGGTTVDHSLLDTLATLPKLHTFHLSVTIGNLDETRVTSFIKACPALCVLSIAITTPDGWTPEQRERVQTASDDAGVTFTYQGRQL